jgi:uncharacterized protein YndB with AHSA1/START domain
MTVTTESNVTTTQVHRVYIRATPEAIWDAITTPEWSRRYGYGGESEYDLRPGGAFVRRASEEMLAHGAPDVILDGEVLEADPPRRLVQTWRMLMEEDLAAEGFTRLTYELEPMDGGVTRLTVTHDLGSAPKLAVLVANGMDGTAGGGWSWVLSDLKSLLETGQRLGG